MAAGPRTGEKYVDLAELVIFLEQLRATANRVGMADVADAISADMIDFSEELERRAASGEKAPSQSQTPMVFPRPGKTMKPQKTIEVKSIEGHIVRIRVYSRGIVIERGEEVRAFIAGVAVPDWLVEKDPEDIDPRELFCIKSPEVISRMIVVLGPRRVLSALGGKIVDRRHREVLIVFDAEGRRRAYLRRGWHPEPWRLEEVDGSIMTVEAARAWQERRKMENPERGRKWRGLHS